MNQTAMQWTIVFLLILIIILLSVCIHLDIQFDALFQKDDGTAATTPPDTHVPGTAPGTTLLSSLTTALPHTTAPPSLVTTVPTTTTPPPVTTAPTTVTPPATTAPPVTTAPPTTTAAPVTTERPYNPSAPTICIDPGHGFTDPGALGYRNGLTIFESTINLEVSLKLKAALVDMGYNVIMTHDGVNLPPDKYLSASSPIYNVNNRQKWILDRKADIDLVISVHCNKHTTSSPNGSRYYILHTSDDGYNSRSYTLMAYLLSSVRTAFNLAKEPTWARQELAVLRTNLPSVLIECGFLSNAKDLANLVDPNWQEQYAQAIANGIAAYCKAYVK